MHASWIFNRHCCLLSLYVAIFCVIALFGCPQPIVNIRINFMLPEINVGLPSQSQWRSRSFLSSDFVLRNVNVDTMKAKEQLLAFHNGHFLKHGSERAGLKKLMLLRNIWGVTPFWFVHLMFQMYRTFFKEEEERSTATLHNIYKAEEKPNFPYFGANDASILCCPRRSLQSLVEFCKEEGLIANHSKTKVILLSEKPSHHKYQWHHKHHKHHFDWLRPITLYSIPSDYIGRFYILYPCGFLD